MNQGRKFFESRCRSERGDPAREVHMNRPNWLRFARTVIFGLVALCGASPTLAFERITYYHNDVIGSPIAATDASGNVVWKEGYAPYGQRLKVQDGGSNEIWFHGKPSDSETGL